MGDYKEIKKECEDRLAKLEGQLAEKSNTVSVGSIEKSLDKAIQTLTNIDVMFDKGTVTDRRTIISSIFPEKITFDGSQYRTPRLNSVANYIYLINSNLHQIKNRKSEDFFHLSGMVAPSRINNFVTTNIVFLSIWKFKDVMRA